jgi:tRNA(Ile2) C34 agmatinyltransferase TiaS
MTNKEVEDFVNWLQSLTAKKFYSEDAEDLIHEYKNKALSQHDVIKSVCPKCKSDDWDSIGKNCRCNKCNKRWKQTVL